MTRTVQELCLDPDGRALAACHYPAARADAPRVLALHGWLDNAASFAPLAERLTGIELVALDFPGHGHSAHRPPRTWYHYVDYLDDVLAALDALGWERCHLLGHSLGGAVASVLAAARPARVERLLLIEALGPVAFRSGSAVASLRTALDERAAWAGKERRVFASFDEPLRARQQAGALSEAAARALVTRNLREVAGGWEWRSDPRLKVATPARVHESQVREWLAAIACPTLLIAADDAPPYFDAALRRERSACVPDLREVVLPGGHHLHLENPASVASAIAEFLAPARVA